MSRTRIAILGGDERERELILALAEAGYRAVTSGRSLSPAEEAAGALVVDLGVALACPVVIGPMAGVHADGRTVSRLPHEGVTLTPELTGSCRRGQLWLCGELRGPIGEWLAGQGIEHVNIAQHEELATLNSIPSAEGALLLALRESPLCLHGSECLVLGYGRCGSTLAGMLRGIGSLVTVVVRSPEARARAITAGHRAALFDEVARLLPSQRFCFNTVPAMVLDGKTLQLANRALTIIDLASAPGGVDFAAAEALGLRAILAPGLPGLVAPSTAGQYLARTILALLKEREI